MSVFDESVTALRGKPQVTEFVRMKDVYGGIARITIPVVLSTFAGFSSRDATIHLHVVMKDTLTPDERRRHRYPPDLPCENDWPFCHRILTRERVPTTVEKLLGFMIDEGSLRFALDRSTVELEVYALHGVEVEATIGLAADGQESFQLADEQARSDPLQRDIGQLTVKITIIRLADQAQMPENGAPIRGEAVLPQLSYDGNRRGVPRGAMSFDVRHLRDGIAITWLPTRQILTLTLTDLTDARQGFAVSFNPAPKFHERGTSPFTDLLHVRVTAGVTVAVTNPLRPDDGTDMPSHAVALLEQLANHYDGNFYGEKGAYTRQFVDPFALDAWLDEHGEPRGTYPALPTRDIAESRFFALEEVPSIRNLPPHGAPFRVKADKGEALYDMWRKEPETTGEALAKAALDIGLGFIPFVGDAADFAEFNAAMASGNDRWGRPVARWEVALMGLSVIPLIGTVAAVGRYGGRLVRVLTKL